MYGLRCIAQRETFDYQTFLAEGQRKWIGVNYITLPVLCQAISLAQPTQIIKSTQRHQYLI